MKNPLDFLKYGVKEYSTRDVLDNIDEADIVEAMEQYADYKVKNVLNKKEKKELLSLSNSLISQFRHYNVSVSNTYERTKDVYFQRILNGNNSKIQLLEKVIDKLGLFSSTEP